MVQVFIFFSIVKESSSFCRENENFRKGPKKVKNYHLLESTIAPIMLRNMLGPIFDSRNVTLLAIFVFLFSKFVAAPLFIAFSANICILTPTPQKIGTLFVNTTALTHKKSFFSAFVFFLFLLCPFLPCCKKAWKQNNKKETRPEDANKTTSQSCYVKKQTTQTYSNTSSTSSLFRLETNNTRTNNNNKSILSPRKFLQSTINYAVTIFSSETIIFLMQLHLPYFSQDSSQYAFAAFKNLGIIYFMQLQFWRFSELTSRKLLGGW